MAPRWPTSVGGLSSYYGETFAEYDKAIVNGTTHWYRKVLWARDDLVKEGKLIQEGDKIYLMQYKHKPESYLFF